MEKNDRTIFLFYRQHSSSYKETCWLPTIVWFSVTKHTRVAVQDIERHQFSFNDLLLGVEEVMTLNMCLIYAQSLPLPPRTSLISHLSCMFFLIIIVHDSLSLTCKSSRKKTISEKRASQLSSLYVFFLCNLWSHFWWLRSVNYSVIYVYHVRVETVSETHISFDLSKITTKKKYEK